MSRLLAAIRRRTSLALLPLSVIPFVAVAPMIVRSHERFQREHQIGPPPTSVAQLSAAETARFRPLLARRGAVPVFAWHGIAEVRGRSSTSRRAFARRHRRHHHHPTTKR